jgi:hypothetical protein
MTTTARTRTLLLILVPALLAAALSIVGMLGTTGLPAQLAAHWGPDGTVDRTDTVWSFVWLVGILVPVFAIAIAAFTIVPLRTGTSRLFLRTVIGLSIWFGVFISLSMYLSVLGQRGVTDVEALPLSSALLPLGVAFLVGTVLAVVGALLAPRVPIIESSTGTVHALDLAAGEQAFWTGNARSPRGVIAIPIVVAVLVTALYTLLGLPVWATILVVLVIGASTTALAWRVVVDRRGITVTGLLGFPRFHTPIEAVVAATTIEIRALRDFGGWGLRIGRGGQWGVIVRSGEALEVERSGRAPFVVTVDDAQTGAGLLTALARRAAL